jgi:hypothetical protein
LALFGSAKRREDRARRLVRQHSRPKAKANGGAGGIIRSQPNDLKLFSYFFAADRIPTILTTCPNHHRYSTLKLCPIAALAVQYFPSPSALGLKEELP